MMQHSIVVNCYHITKYNTRVGLRKYNNKESSHLHLNVFNIHFSFLDEARTFGFYFQTWASKVFSYFSIHSSKEIASPNELTVYYILSQ